MPTSSPYSTDTEPESIPSNLPQNLLLCSPRNALLLSSISEKEDVTTPTIDGKMKVTINPNQNHQIELELDSDDEEDLDQLSIHHNSSHYKQFGDMENEEIIQDGYLEKKGERRKRWQKRWFVLRKTSLVYYKNDKEYRLLRMIPLTDIHTCAEVQVKQHDYTFGIVTSARTYYVRAKTRAERDTWTSKVTEAKDALKNASTSKTQIRKHSGDDIIASNVVGIETNPITRAHTVIGSGLGENLEQRRISEVKPASILSNSTSTQFSNTLTSKPFGRSAGAPPPGHSIYSPEPCTTSSALSSASDNALMTRARAWAPPKTIRSPLLSDILAEELNDPISLPLNPRPDLSSGGSSNGGHELNYLSSSYSQATNTQGMISSSEEEEEEEESFHPNLLHSTITTAEPLPMVGITTSSTSNPVVAENESASPPIGERKLTLPEAGRTIIQGYLMKQGKRKTWRKRYFILTSQKLVCSRTHMDKGGRGVKEISVGRILDAIEYHSSIPLSRHVIGSPLAHHSSLSSTESSAEDRIEHCFKIITSDRTYLVNAPTEEDEIRWISALRCLLATYRTNHPKQFNEILDQRIVGPPTAEMAAQSISGNKRQLSTTKSQNDETFARSLVPQTTF
ncbi:hypothetical protein CROQUDRAFT_38563 [Cronartium quercuum f. sp. fusiforme G11]|uniref:PH domain-containing protein n=1 Tax=Cronartium quercuum f. sp. fusiforme G11 TaxID=708437 RepID=A0A9P6TFC9_9BASI|nr:hypothetical protein CROQUDRAFT_38563 [Cronartium quercuum f. sp. fusiforme G11]